MGQFSVEKPVAPGSVLSGNQHSNYKSSESSEFEDVSSLISAGGRVSTKESSVGGLGGGLPEFS